ncbi:MAG: EpsI family protein [Aquabacterium sp.]
MTSSRLLAALVAATLMAVASWFGAWAQPTKKMADMYPRQSLGNLFADQIGEWSMDKTTLNVPLPPDVAAQVKEIYTEVADRSYVTKDGRRMMVTVAYGRDQSDGFKVHRPEVCYAAQGFTVGDALDAKLDLGGRQIDVKHVDTHKESRAEPVTYWMVIGDNVVNTPSKHKLFQMKYAFDGLIADGLLVRVSSLSNDPAQAYAEQAAFVRDWMAHVPASQRTRLFGI